MSRCLPVKYGWQALQTSTWIEAAVVRVSNLFPHAHTASMVRYMGWIFGFTVILRKSLRAMKLSGEGGARQPSEVRDGLTALGAHPYAPGISKPENA